MTGWIGNVFIFIGLWLVGYKWRSAFLFSVVGEVIWVYHAASQGMWDLAAICVVFTVLACRNWYLWGKE